MELEISDCNACPFKTEDRDMQATLTSCQHPNSPSYYESLLEDNILPVWCPLIKEEFVLKLNDKAIERTLVNNIPIVYPEK